MFLTRRTCGAVTLGSLAGALPHPASAQESYPSRSVTITVPFPAGGSTDTVARLLAARLGTDTGQPFVVDNRGGANGTVGSALVARARPEGYNLLFTPNSSYAMGAHLYPLTYDNERAFVGVGLVASMPIFMVVPKNLPARTLQEFIEVAKRPSQKLFYANSGVGSSTHLATEMFFQQAGIEMPDVVYRGGGPALQGVLQGEAQMVFQAASGVIPFLQSGDVRALAVTTKQRSDLAPDVPTFAEAGFPDYEVVEHIALFAPAGTPAPVVRRINAAVASAMNHPEIVERLRTLAVTPTVGTPEEFPVYFAAENAKWREVIRSRNIRIQ
ncbi:Bug family tripartite tricarboxylate transporter substrate binding protein [Roseomonas sp. GCM10028921]